MKKLILLLLFAGLGTAFAGVEVHQFEQAEQEQQYNRLIAELRCLVCQNQNLADSNASLARDLRHQVLDQIQAGKNDEQVIDYLVARYGDFVLYKPPFKGATMFLWIGPFVFFVIAVVALFTLIRRRNQIKTTSLSTEEAQKLQDVLRHATHPDNKDA